MFVCTFVCLYVCLFVCRICPPDRASFDTRVVHGKKQNLSAEVPIGKLTPPHPRFSLYARKRTQLSYPSTIFFSYLSTIFFYKFLSYLTSLLIKSLTRYMLLYICNKYKRLIESLTTCILLYISKRKRKYKKTYRIPNDIYLIIYL